MNINGGGRDALEHWKKRVDALGFVGHTFTRFELLVLGVTDEDLKQMLKWSLLRRNSKNSYTIEK